MLNPIKAAVLIADICGSTALYEHIGDILARQLIERAFESMVSEIPVYQGTLIDAVGDEILCTYANPELALNCACAMQKAIKKCAFEGNETLRIRIGVHYGDVFLRKGAVFGDIVNITARVAAIAKANQIMTTQAVFNELPPNLKEKTHKFMCTGLKGKSSPFDIFLVTWEPDDLSGTCYNTPLPNKLLETAYELSFFYNGQSVKVNKEKKIVTLGRSESCDIYVHSTYTSREHAYCEWRFGKLVLVDHSINGTFIRFNDGKEITLLREEVILYDSGTISLGRDNFEIDSELIEFHTYFNLE